MTSASANTPLLNSHNANYADFFYLATEKELGEQCGVKITAPIRLFSLSGLGFDETGFIREFAPTFLLLKWDPYDVKREQVALLKRCFKTEERRLNRFLADYYENKDDLEGVYDLVTRLSPEEQSALERIRPRRKRSIARFCVGKNTERTSSWGIERIPAGGFLQDVAGDDLRSVLKREFEEARDMIAQHPLILELLRRIAEMVREVRPDAKFLDITMHRVSILADIINVGDNAPEGVHQDGADFIVSALVIERKGIIGGESVVYGPDRKAEYLRTTLVPGQGIFQADKNSPLWHDVTRIRYDPATPPLDGKRCIFGFDINVIEKK